MSFWLVELVNFRPDLFLGLQRHQDELAIPCRIKHSAKLDTLDGETFDVLHTSFPNAPFSFCPMGPYDDIQNNYTLVRPRGDSSFSSI